MVTSIQWSANVSDILEKWGEDVASRGFAQIPNYLLLINQFLDEDSRLSPIEQLVLIQLIGNWWKKDELPFPSMSTLAQRIGVSSRQIQRAVNHLDNIGLIKRTKRRQSGLISSNAYDLTPLVNMLQKVSEMFPNEFPRRLKAEKRMPLKAEKKTIHLDKTVEE